MARSRVAEAERPTRQQPAARASGEPATPQAGPGLADVGLIAAFLALAFLLGCFPLNDTDFWWHLKTGDLIRKSGSVPAVDTYTFGAEGQTWIDLHWLFQVGLSWGYAHGGVVTLNLAKCVITCAALLLLVTARRPGWPVWAMLLAWLPALLVLSGRMYVRPETVTLLYLAAFLAVLFRIDRRPRLAFALPAVQVLWVNTQGLFVFGPILFGAALLDAALRPDAFAPARHAWWRTVGLAALLTLAACLLNPYGLLGAFYPVQLAATMNNPEFGNIGELKSIPRFIHEAGFGNLPLQLHLLTMALGALSFLLPAVAWAAARLGRPAAARPTRTGGDSESAAGKPKKSKTTRRKAPSFGLPRPLRILLAPLRFRPLLFAAFSLLSLKATRNSHQFAAVVGTITAWNVGAWAATRGSDRPSRREPARRDLGPRLLTFGAIGAVFAFVASGAFYAAAGEGRTIGLGEKPLWFPHAAARFAGTPGLPEKFVCIHNGHAALFEYYHAPERKAYTDARLEVMGADLYARYNELTAAIAGNAPGWSERVTAVAGGTPPGLLIDLVQIESGAAVASALAHPAWRCAWFDPTAAVFVPEGPTAAVRAVDFRARHFEPEPGTDPAGVPALTASARAIRNVAHDLPPGRPDKLDPLVLLGVGHARRAIHLAPGEPEAWRLLGQFDLFRIPAAGVGPGLRYRGPFEPTTDMPLARSAYALRRFLDLQPDDLSALTTLGGLFAGQGMWEAAAPLFEHALEISEDNRAGRLVRADITPRLALALGRLGPMPDLGWKNLSELDRATTALLDSGRVATAADLLERAYPARERTWAQADQVATLRLHLGQPERARALWQTATSAPRPGLRAARIATTSAVELDDEAARRAFAEALAAEPDLFEAHYGLAMLERDAGRRKPARDAARAALKHAPTDAARAAARALLREVGAEDEGP